MNQADHPDTVRLKFGVANLKLSLPIDDEIVLVHETRERIEFQGQLRDVHGRDEVGRGDKKVHFGPDPHSNLADALNDCAATIVNGEFPNTLAPDGLYGLGGTSGRLWRFIRKKVDDDSECEEDGDYPPQTYRDVGTRFLAISATALTVANSPMICAETVALPPAQT